MSIKNISGSINININSSKEGMETVSFDAGWQTRGSGRNYASLSSINGQLFKRHYLYVYAHVLYKSIFYISSMASVACQLKTI